MMTSCNPPGDYRICDRHGNGPGPCRSDIRLAWENDCIPLEDLIDPEVFDSKEKYEEWLRKPHNVLCLVAFDKRTNQSVYSLGGIIDPSRGDIEEFEKYMLKEFPEHPWQACSDEQQCS